MNLISIWVLKTFTLVRPIENNQTEIDNAHLFVYILSGFVPSYITLTSEVSIGHAQEV